MELELYTTCKLQYFSILEISTWTRENGIKMYLKEITCEDVNCFYLIQDMIPFFVMETFHAKSSGVHNPGLSNFTVGEVVDSTKNIYSYENSALHVMQFLWNNGTEIVKHFICYIHLH